MLGLRPLGLGPITQIRVRLRNGYPLGVSWLHCERLEVNCEVQIAEHLRLRSSCLKRVRRAEPDS